MSSGHILLVEDEAGLRRGIRMNLEAEGYSVTEFPDGEAALLSIGEDGTADFDLGILDIMMPGSVDGLDLCRSLRQQKLFFPVIFLTARDAAEDKLVGFAAGADDYLTKPFDLGELLARVQAQFRRSSWQREAAAIPEDVRIGGWNVNLRGAVARRTDSAGAENVVRFNERELAILRLLIEHRGRPVRRDEILDRVWGTAEFPTNRTIDNYIVKFRKIFEDNPQAPQHFVTRHGIGYELSQ